MMSWLTQIQIQSPPKVLTKIQSRAKTRFTTPPFPACLQTLTFLQYSGTVQPPRSMNTSIFYRLSDWIVGIMQACNAHQITYTPYLI